MLDGTSLLFALPGFRVLDVSLGPGGGRLVTVEIAERSAGCLSCGVITDVVHDRPRRMIKDVPHGRLPLTVELVGRRLRCAEAACPRRSFVQVCDELPLRSRLTCRLRDAVTRAVTGSNRAVSDVAREYAVSWPTEPAWHCWRL